jgi:hypothetical protein
MLYSEIIAVCSQIHTKHTNIRTMCGQNVELLHVKARGAGRQKSTAQPACYIEHTTPHCHMRDRSDSGPT